MPAKIARQVEAFARQRDLSANRMLVDLIEQEIEAQQQKEKAFFQLAECFRAASDPDARLAGLVDIHLPFHWLVLCGVLGTG